MDEFGIDSSHLTGKFLKRFKKVEENTCSSFKRAMEGLNDKNRLSYTPPLRVTPFVVVKLKIIRGTTYRQTYYAFTTLDTANFDRFAIYPSLDFLEKFPNYVAAGLGHEIGHVIAFGSKLKVTKEEILEQLADPIKAEKRKEDEMERSLQAFNEGFRREVVEWNGVGQNRDFKAFLVEKAWIQNQDQFETFFLGKSRKLLDEYRQTLLRDALQM